MSSRALPCLLALFCWSSIQPAMADEWTSPGPGRTDVGDFAPRDDGPGFLPSGSAPSSYQSDPSRPRTGEADLSPGDFGDPSEPTFEKLRDEAKLMSEFDSKTKDPDSSTKMLLAWDEWHRAVNNAVFVRFDKLAKKQWPDKPRASQVTYTVTCDRTINNVRIVQKSPDVAFNSLVFVVLRSMNGDKLLDFPKGSHRQSVEKSSTFSVNCGHSRCRPFWGNPSKTWSVDPSKAHSKSP